MFPWFPFFVYPTPEDGIRRGKGGRRHGGVRNFQESILEVHAVDDGVAAATMLAQSCSGEDGTSAASLTMLQIRCQRKPMATSMRMRLNGPEEEERSGRRKMEERRRPSDDEPGGQSTADPCQMPETVFSGGEFDGREEVGMAREGSSQIGDKIASKDVPRGQVPSTYPCQMPETTFGGEFDRREKVPSEEESSTNGKMMEKEKERMGKVDGKWEKVEEDGRDGEDGHAGADAGEEWHKVPIGQSKMGSQEKSIEVGRRKMSENGSREEAEEEEEVAAKKAKADGMRRVDEADSLVPLLPKAPTEEVHVEFGGKEEAGMDEEEVATINGSQKAPIMAENVVAVRCSATPSTSSSSGQLAPRAGSVGGKISGKKGTSRGTSGSRSGTSSAKQSPRPVHRSTDSIASALKQVEKMAAATPPLARRRKSAAFETSSAMRELFGRTEESPFAGLETAKIGRRRREEDKNDKKMVVGKEEGEIAERNEAGRSEAGTERKKEHLTGDGAATTCAQEAATTTTPIDRAMPPMNGSAEEEVGHLKENGGGDEPIERRRQNGVEKDGQEEGKKKSQMEEEEVQKGQQQPMGHPHIQQSRSNSRPRSVARVAPFAYFPPSEEPTGGGEEHYQQQTAALTGRRRIAAAHQLLDNNGCLAVAELLQSEEIDDAGDDIEGNPLKQSLAQNGTKSANFERGESDKSWQSQEASFLPKEEGDGYKGEKGAAAFGWEQEGGQHERRPNGTESQGNWPPANNNKEEGTKTTTSLERRETGKTEGGALPGDQQQKPAKVLTTTVGKEGPKQSGGGQRGPQQQQATGNGIGRGEGGEGRGDSKSTSSSGGGGGGGPPPSSLEPLQMANDGAGGANGGSSANGGAVGPQLLIRNAMVLNDDDFFAADVLIEEGIIREISQEPIKSVGPQCEQIDANGRCLLPAGIDFQPANLASADAIGSGTKAALCGGTGTVIAQISLRPEDAVSDAAISAALDRLRAQIDSAAECSVGLSATIGGQWRGEQSRQEMTRLAQRGGMNTFVLDLANDADLIEAMDHAKAIGTVCRVAPGNKPMMAMLERRMHAQRISSSSATTNSAVTVMEKLDAQRVQQLCHFADELTNAPVVIQSIHSSTLAHAIIQCATKGIVGCEVPIGDVPRGSELLGTLASLPNLVCISGENGGTEAVKRRMASIWQCAVVDGKLSPMQFVAATSTNAAKMLNLYPRKGRVAVGSDADLVLWDLQGGRVDVGPQLVILGGQTRFRQPNQFVESPPKMGKPAKFLPLAPNSPHLFAAVRLREGTFNFADFRRHQQSAVTSPTSRAGSTTGMGTPEEVGGGGTGAARPGSRNRNAQSDQPASRATTKVIHPPGGKSSTLW